jgi:hypothetical protein
MADIALGAYLSHQEIDFEFVEVTDGAGIVHYNLTSLRLSELSSAQS